MTRHFCIKIVVAAAFVAGTQAIGAEESVRAEIAPSLDIADATALLRLAERGREVLIEARAKMDRLERGEVMEGRPLTREAADTRLRELEAAVEAERSVAAPSVTLDELLTPSARADAEALFDLWSTEPPTTQEAEEPGLMERLLSRGESESEAPLDPLIPRVPPETRPERTDEPIPVPTPHPPSPEMPAPDVSSQFEQRIDETWYVSVQTANVRSGPGTNHSIVTQLDQCATVAVRREGGSEGWYIVALPSGDAFMAGSVMSSSEPSSCRGIFGGRIDDVLDTANLIVNGQVVSLHGVRASRLEEHRIGMKDFIDQRGGIVDCERRAGDRYRCLLRLNDNPAGVDLGLTAIVNGAACPASGAPSNYINRFVPGSAVC